MPLTQDGLKVLEEMQKRYGKSKGKQVFYASINKGRKGSEKWHKQRKGNPYSKGLKGGKKS